MTTRSILLRFVCLAWIAGLGAAHFFHWSVFGGMLLLLLGGLVSFPWRTSWSVTHILYAVVFLSAFVRVSALAYVPFADIHDPHLLASHVGERITVRAVVVDVLSRTPSNLRFIARVSSPYVGNIHIRTVMPVEIQYGAEVILFGELRKPLDSAPEFSWRTYLASKNVSATMENPDISATGNFRVPRILRSVAALRERILSNIAFLLPARSAALLSGLLLGMKGSFSREFLDNLQATGLTHIVALSGFNITVLISFIAGFLLRGAGRFWRFALSAAAIIFFILLAGPSASVVRAAIMGILALLALIAGRKAEPINMLLLALVAMTAWNPDWLFQDIGFQLSFLATLGIVLLVPVFALLTSRFHQRWRFLVLVLATTLSAQIVTLPLLLFHFGALSLIAPATNLLVVPVVPFAMLLGAIPVLFSLTPFMGQLAVVSAFLAHIPLSYISHVISFFGDLPLAATHITWWNGWWTAGSYVAMGTVYSFLKRSILSAGPARNNVHVP